MQFIDSIIKKLKVKEIISILFFTTLILTIIPIEILTKLGLDDFIQQYKMYISLCLIVCSAYYLLKVFTFISQFILNRIFSDKKVAIKYMKNHMSPDEISLIIQTFYDSHNDQFKATGYIDYSDGRKTALESKNIIYISSQISSFGTEFSYNLQPYARVF